MPRRAGAPTRDGLLVRTVDVLVALIALLVFSPIMLFSAATIALTSSGPILFRQQRIGRDGELFTCLKFRTMHVNASEMLDALLADCPAARAEWAENHKLRNDPRIIGIGNFLRRTSLDELPQIFNVLAGEMAIVGPRPIVTGEIARYGRYIGDYCSVRPGITGLWQVSGRSETSYRCRVACDRLYARRKSILGDIRIMACTVPVVLLGQGAC
ncbi:sugar transferase [Polymorphobacter multimanifer]|uniref:sugar transferase n=1 Tax=Polymorphobacter multimanifer TaxID=1070431 RepID=UPI002435C4F2|nr:sugar transferase [Polymorphobacter multimanifer]